MKNRTFLCSFAFLILFFMSASATNYYVATSDPNAADTNNGTSISTPFKTIQKAALVAVAGDVVNIRAGLYRESVRPTNSGTANARIVYQPYNGEEVTISGSEVISNFTLHQGNIYKATMAGNFFTNPHNQTDQIFVNDEMMFQARWPNNTTSNPSFPAKSSLSTFISKATGTNGLVNSVFTDSKLAQDINFVGAEIYLQPDFEAWSWTLSGIVTAVSGTQISFSTPSPSGQGGGGNYPVGSRYYLYNSLALLDAEREWYHDIATNTLYLWCPNNADPNTLKVEAKKREFAFDLSERSYITLKDIKIFASTITTDAQAGGDNKSSSPNGGAYYPWRGRDFTASATGIKLDGIDAKYITHYTDVSGHFFLQWGLSSGIVISGTNHEVRNCKVQYSAGNGFAVNGKGHKLINNEILDVNYLSNDASAINTAQPGAVYDIEIAYNTVKRTGRSGITPRGMVNSTVNNYVTRIHHNDVSEYMIQDWDGGGVYAATGNHKFIRVDHNTFYNSVNGFLNSGVYFDFSANVVVDHNVIWDNDWPLHFQGYGDGNLNNTLCYNNTALARNAGNKGSIGVENSVGSNKGTLIQNNILIFADGNNTTPTGTFTPISISGFANATKINNFTTASGNPNFINLVSPDLQLNSNSPCKDAGLIMNEMVIDGWTVPAYNEPLNGKADIGAYEYGNPKFATGANLTADNEAPSSPVDLTSEKVIANKLMLKWKPSTDNVGITAYYIYRDGVFIGYTEYTFYTVTGLNATNNYKFDVKAVDYRGNISEPAKLNVSTSVVDLTPPTAPTNLNVTNQTLTGFTVVWDAATDNNYIEKYEIKINGISKGYVAAPITELDIKNLSANTLYVLSVTSFDGSGNATTSESVNVKTGNAALIVNESFNYTADFLNPDADGASSGYGYPASNFEILSTGLYGAWGTKSKVKQTSLIYNDKLKNALLTAGKALDVQNGTGLLGLYTYMGLDSDPFGSYRIEANKDFGVNGTEIWISTVMSVTDNSKDIRFAFLNYLKKNNFSFGLKDQKWCIIDSTLNKIGGVSASINTATLLLLKVSYGNTSITSRDDKVELWVNPDLTGNLPAADATYDGMVGNFGRYTFNSAWAATVAPVLTIDEFRIGLQKEDVLPLGVYSNIIQNSVNQHNIYPTITSDNIKVADLEGYRVSIFDVNGKLIYSKNIENTLTNISVNTFGKGIYFVKASVKNDTKNFKFIVQ